MLTAAPEQTAAVLAHAHGPVRDCWLLDTRYAVFAYQGPNGLRLEVASVEVGAGQADAAAELGRLSVLRPEAVLVLVGLARPARAAVEAEVITAELLLGRGAAGDRPMVARSSPELAAVARRLSHCSGRAVVGVLSCDEEVLDQLGRGELPALAVEACGTRFASALAGVGRMKRLVVCGLVAEGDGQQELVSASRAAAAFAFTALLEQARLLQLEAPEQGPASPLGLVTSTSAADEERSMAEEARLWVDAVALDPPLVDDDGAAAAALARSDFLTADSLFFYELVYEVVAHVDDVSHTWGGRSLRAYGRECARAMASLCDVAPVRPGSPADMTVRFPIEEMLQLNPVGAAVMLSVPEAWRCLGPAVRDRILSALSGPAEAPRPPTEVGWLCLLGLVLSAQLSPAEGRRVARVVVVSSYDLLVRVRAPLALVRDKALADLMSGVAARQDRSARYLYRDGGTLPGQLAAHDDYEVGRQLHTASRAGSSGAAEALSRANLARASAARRAGVLMAALLIDDRYLRLELPAGERRVLAATSLAGDLADVLAVASSRLPPPVARGELAGYLAHDTVDRLLSLARELARDEAALWEEFVGVLRQRV